MPKHKRHRFDLHAVGPGLDSHPVLASERKLQALDVSEAQLRLAG